MHTADAIEHQWPYLRSFLPSEGEIERLAHDTGALVRRREVKSGDTLLRLALMYGFCGYSLRQTAAWAESIELASLSDVALLKRLRVSGEFVSSILARVLGKHVALPGSAATRGRRIRLVDGTNVSAPGSAGSDWRVHLGFDLLAERIASIELTSARVGESFKRFQPDAGELFIADRGYANAAGLKWVHQHGAYFLVRLPWSSLVLRHPDGRPFDLFAWLGSAPEAEPHEAEVRIKGDGMPLRLLALRKTEAAAAKTRRKILSRATNHTNRTDPRTLEAAAFIILVTNLPSDELSAQQAFDLYRFRWQIELCFKQMKSVISLDALEAKDPGLARTVLGCKLLGALLIEQLSERYVSFSPWGYALGEPPYLPLASVAAHASDP